MNEGLLWDYIQKRNKGIRFDEWLWGFANFGKPTQVRVALVSRSWASLPIWESYSEKWDENHAVFGSLTLRELLVVIETELTLPSSFSSAIYGAFGSAQDVEEKAYFNANEGSVTYDDQLQQLHALYAASAVVWTGKAALWTPPNELAFDVCSDAAELSARRAAGPDYEVFEAVWYAKRALQATDADMIECIVSSLEGVIRT